MLTRFEKLQIIVKITQVYLFLQTNITVIIMVTLTEASMFSNCFFDLTNVF